MDAVEYHNVPITEKNISTGKITSNYYKKWSYKDLIKEYEKRKKRHA